MDVIKETCTQNSTMKVVHQSNGTKYTLYFTRFDYENNHPLRNIINDEITRNQFDCRLALPRFGYKWLVALEFWNTWMWVDHKNGLPHYTYVREKMNLRSDTDAQAVVDAIQSQLFQAE